jgi:hypothetical protein
MTPIHRAQIEHPMAWRGAESRKEAIAFDLGERHRAVLGARSEFADSDLQSEKRLMLRLWLDAERKRRPVVPEIHIYENAGGRSGIDPQPGRVPAAAKSRARDEDLLRPVAAE